MLDGGEGGSGGSANTIPMQQQRGTAPDNYLKPHFAEFCVGDGAQYEIFKERVSIYFCTVSYPKDIQVAVFLSAINQDVYKLIRALVAPAKAIECTLQDILKALDNHFNVKVNKRAQRHKFHRVQQETGEKLSEFVVRLREAAEQCQYGDFLSANTCGAHLGALRQMALEDRLLDAFVMGVKSKRIQQALLETEPKSLKEAYDRATTIEMAYEERNVQEVNVVKKADPVGGHLDDQSTGEVNFVRGAKQKQRAQAGPMSRGLGGGSSPRAATEAADDDTRCFRCGRERHHINKCPAKNARCHQCNRLGHFKSFCQSRDKKVQLIAAVGDKNEPLNLTIKINDHSIPITIDSGACSNLISPGFVNNHLKDVKLSKNSFTNLHVLTGHELNCRGAITVPVEYGGLVFGLEFQVVDIGREYTPIMGRPGLNQFFPKWRDAFKISSVNTINSSIIENLKTSYPTVFDMNLKENINGFEADIHLKENHIPIYAKAYNLPMKYEKEVKEQIKKMVDDGTLNPCTTSRYASPIVVVPKADNKSIRICIDCKRTINQFIVNSNFYPLPHQDSIFASMVDSSWFCTLDLTQAYQQLKLSPRSKEYLTINTPFGLFQYAKLPYGVSAAPSIFQSVIDKIIAGIPRTRAFLDDIIIGGITKNECESNLNQVLERLAKYNVKVNLGKCKFLTQAVTYLGHTISNGNIKAGSGKLDALLGAPKPANAKELQSFLGLINFFRKFVPKMSEKLKVLYDLLVKNVKFNWTAECDAAFELGKRLVSKESCLEIFDPRRPTLVFCDASPIGISAVLVQRNCWGEEKPVYYASAKLNKTQQNYAQLHREGLAVIFGLKKFYKYLYGRKFTIVTDAASIKEMFKPDRTASAVASARIQRWGVYLAMFDYEIIHRPSSKMTVPDALSRLPLAEEAHNLEDESVDLIGICEQLPIKYEDIVKEYVKDEELQKVVKWCEKGFPNNTRDGDLVLEKWRRYKCNLALEDGLLTYNDRIVIPFTLRTSMLEFLHQGHSGIVLMKKLARSHVFWPGIDKDIEMWISGCMRCQEFSNVPPKPVVSSWPKTSAPWERLHADFFHFQGKSFLILVDAFSKFIEVKCMKLTNAERVIAVLDRWFGFFGLPRTLVTDNGPPFNSHILKKYCNDRNICLLHSPAYHPESNGQAEVSVRIVKNGLKKLCSDATGNVELELEKLLVVYRNSPRSTGPATPMEQLLCYKPRTMLELVKPRNNVTLESVNKIEKDPYGEFKVGDLLYYRSHFNDHINWIPCKILKRNSKYIYEISIYDHTRLVHVSKLRIRKNQIVNFPTPLNLENYGQRVKDTKRKRSPESEIVIPRRSERLKKKRLLVND